MRIGIFTECFSPVLNGVSVSMETFMKSLEKRGHEFFIFTTGSLNKCDDPNNVTRIPILLPFEPKGGKYPIARPQKVDEWVKIIEPYNLDIIWSQHLLSLGALGLKVAKKLDIPVILTYHTLLTGYAHYIPLVGFLAKRWLIYKSRRYCNQYDAIVSPSDSMKKLLLSYGVTIPITTIPTGIEPSNFTNHYSKEELKKKFKIPAEHDFLFLYTSRIGKEKNVNFLLLAMKKFVFEQKHQNAHLLMVGGGDDLEKTIQYAKKLGLENYVTFAGKQPKEETNKIFGGADAFVFSSITETQGIIIFEAQAAGLPTIAVKIMGPSNYVKDGDDGFLVPLKIEVFADKMEYLSNHDEIRIKMGQRAKNNVLHYTAEKCGQMMEQLLERTVNNHNRS